jgi:hypothetical protein
MRVPDEGKPVTELTGREVALGPIPLALHVIVVLIVVVDAADAVPFAPAVR